MSGGVAGAGASWSGILLNWINCYEAEVTEIQQLLTGSGLNNILNVLYCNRDSSLDSSSVDTPPSVEQFVIDKYPEFVFENGTSQPTTEEDAAMAASLLLFYVCVQSKDVHLKKAMCSKLSRADQEVILKFTKCLMHRKPVTCVDVQAAVVESCGQDSFQFMESAGALAISTPPPLRALHGEVRRLRAALEAEQFDRLYLQDELSATSAKVEKLLKDKEQYQKDVLSLKSRLASGAVELETSQDASPAKESPRKVLARQLSRTEERLVDTQGRLDECERERDLYKAKIEDIKVDREKWIQLGQMESARANALSDQLETERQTSCSLRELLAELQTHQKLNKREDSSMLEWDDMDNPERRSLHDSSMCGDLCASVVEVQLFEERARIAHASQQLQALDDKVKGLEKNQNEVKTTILKQRDLLQSQIKESEVLFLSNDVNLDEIMKDMNLTDFPLDTIDIDCNIQPELERNIDISMKLHALLSDIVRHLKSDIDNKMHTINEQKKSLVNTENNLQAATNNQSKIIYTFESKMDSYNKKDATFRNKYNKKLDDLETQIDSLKRLIHIISDHLSIKMKENDNNIEGLNRALEKESKEKIVLEMMIADVNFTCQVSLEERNNVIKNLQIHINQEKALRESLEQEISLLRDHLLCQNDLHDQLKDKNALVSHLEKDMTLMQEDKRTIIHSLTSQLEKEKIDTAQILNEKHLQISELKLKLEKHALRKEQEIADKENLKEALEQKLDENEIMIAQITNTEDFVRNCKIIMSNFIEELYLTCLNLGLVDNEQNSTSPGTSGDMDAIVLLKHGDNTAIEPGSLCDEEKLQKSSNNLLASLEFDFRKLMQKGAYIIKRIHDTTTIKLKAEVENNEKVHLKMHANANLVEALENEVGNLKLQLEEIKEECINVKQQAEELKGEVETKKLHLENTQAKLTKMENVDDKVQDITKELEERRETCHQLSGQLKRVVFEKNAEINDLKKQIHKLSSNESNATQIIESVKIDYERNILNLHDQLKDKNALVSHLEKDMTLMQEDKRTIIHSLTSQLEKEKIDTAQILNEKHLQINELKLKLEKHALRKEQEIADKENLKEALEQKLDENEIMIAQITNTEDFVRNCKIVMSNFIEELYLTCLNLGLVENEQNSTSSGTSGDMDAIVLLKRGDNTAIAPGFLCDEEKLQKSSNNPLASLEFDFRKLMQKGAYIIKRIHDTTTIKLKAEVENNEKVHLKMHANANLVEALENEVGNLKLQLEEIKEECINVKEQAEELKGEVETKKLHLENTQAKLTKMENVDDKVQDITKELEESRETCHQLSGQLKRVVFEKNAEINDLKKQIHKLSSNESNATQIIESVKIDYERNILNLHDQLKDKNALVSHLEKDMTLMQEDKRTIIHSLTSQLEKEKIDTAQILNEKHLQISELKLKLEKHALRKEQEIADKENLKEALEQKLDENEIMIAQITNTEDFVRNCKIVMSNFIEELYLTCLNLGLVENEQNSTSSGTSGDMDAIVLLKRGDNTAIAPGFLCDEEKLQKSSNNPLASLEFDFRKLMQKGAYIIKRIHDTTTIKLKAEVENNEKVHLKMHANANLVEALENEVGNLKLQLEEIKEECINVKEQAEELKGEVETKKLHLENTQAKLTKMENVDDKVQDITKELEESRETCHQLSGQLKRVVFQKNAEINDLKKQIHKLSSNESNATQIIEVSSKYQAIILKRIAEIKTTTVLRELTHLNNIEGDKRKNLATGSVTMDELESFLESTEKNLRKLTEKQTALQKERDRFAEISRINESETLSLKKYLTELLAHFKTFGSIKDVYNQKLSKVISLQRMLRREIHSLEQAAPDGVVSKLVHAYAVVMQDLCETALNLSRWAERCIDRSISPEKLKLAFSSENPVLSTSHFQNTGLEVQIDELMTAFRKVYEEVAQAKRGEVAKSAEACSVMEVRAEYEDKLNRMKAKMKQLYQEQINLYKEKQKEETVRLERELERTRSKLEENSKAYEEHIQGLTRELWSVGEKFLMKKEEAEWLRKKQNSSSLMSLQHVHSSGLGPSDRGRSERAGPSGRPSNVQSLRDFPTHKPGKSEGRGFHMSDEEGEVFDNRWLKELNSTPRRDAGPPHRASERISELKYRNSLCPPHLKSSYPAETQFHTGKIFNEDEIKSEGAAGERRSRKEVGITAYKKPGPPTPSKNAGRLSATDSELRESLRPEPDAPLLRKTTTPSRLRALFRSNKSDAENTGTPRSKRLSIFRSKK